MSIDTLILIVIVIYSIILHEIAHGYIAKLCGDKTAERAGRLTLNPIPHIDIFGSVILPVIAVLSGWGVFGWAKGVPVNPYNLNTRFKEFAVSAAGIATNLLIATLFLLLIKFGVFPNIYNELFIRIAIINIGLGFFNLLPIPPFDGMQILRSIFPSLKHRYQFIEYNPMLMIIMVLFAGYIFSLFYSDLITFILNIFF
ncbi:MAG: hypothetical protein QG614_642 [Patescibacteria group bacterium]|nr:hypothetical protein [Patescibacteria group bacterium]